ncbi:MAG: FGGY family carbohydrate kinase [Planctomycetota bacterium]
MILLGIDLGSSSVKASLLDTAVGGVIGSGQFPETEMAIDAPRPGWAEQDPSAWEDAMARAVAAALAQAGRDAGDVGAVGIGYQMHGLVCLDADHQALRPSIIWCDSRAVEIGKSAFDAIGHDACLSRMLNSPGNFTASKLAWVKRNEPEVFSRIDKIGLPGDYLAARLTGELVTTASGLSEGVLWDFRDDGPAELMLDHFDIPGAMLPPVVPTFGPQGELSDRGAAALGLRPGTPVTYRAGDQPNNALSLNVLQPGEVAATAGTSGVVYGVSGGVAYDPRSRINSFAHVNHTADDPRLGLLLCVNGTGIANAWARRTLGGDLDYPALNDLAEQAPPGSDGLCVLPFGNGAERMLGNADVGAHLANADFNRHGRAHVARATQEGIAFALAHGMDVLRETGVDLSVIRAGRANLFLSPLFRRTLATLTGARIELYDTDGAAGAARGAGIGAGVYTEPAEAFASLTCLETIEPDTEDRPALEDAFARWTEALDRQLTAYESD